MRPKAKDGNTILQASYAHYAGKYNESQIGANTPVANPSFLEIQLARNPGYARLPGGGTQTPAVVRKWDRLPAYWKLSRSSGSVASK